MSKRNRVFDRDQPNEDARALACHDDVIQSLAREGYYPYRLGINAMQPPAGAAAEDGSYLDLLMRLKATFDPNQIVSPGRYGS